MKADVNSFKCRRDRYFFEKLAKHENPQDFLIANFVSDKHRTYIKDLAYSEQSKTIYKNWQKIKESLSYQFQNDISHLDKNFNNNFICSNGNHPRLLKLYFAEKISIETLCILCELSHCLPYWEKQLKEDVIYKDIGLLIRKYTPFIKYDKNKFKEIIRNKLS